METHISRDLQRLKQMVLSMGALVEEAFLVGNRALQERDPNQAERVAAIDKQVDRLELDIDDFCLKLLALYQPVARDLRFVVAVSKITNDLERIGDLSSNIAGRAAVVANLPMLDEPLPLEEMVETTRLMLRGALDAFVSSNTAKAREVCASDDKVDDLNSAVFDRLMARMRTDSGAVEAGVALLSVSHNIERCADLATNIAEDVVFLEEAIDIRHPSLG